MIGLERDWSKGIIVSVQREMERFLGDFSSRKPPSARFSPRAWEPAIDVYETTNEIVVLVELAGIKHEEIEVVADIHTLVIRGERKDIKQGIKRSYYQMEILWGPFERGIALPVAVEVSKVKAFYEGGLLEVILPKLV